jgi:hypothetical protein
VTPDILAVMKRVRIHLIEAGLSIDLAKCFIKTAAVDIATEFPCDFCIHIVRFTLSNVDLLKSASIKLLQLVLSCDFVYTLFKCVYFVFCTCTYGERTRGL